MSQVQYSADRNMLKNEIHDIVISLENIREFREEAKRKYAEAMNQADKDERYFIKYLSNL